MVSAHQKSAPTIFSKIYFIQTTTFKRIVYCTITSQLQFTLIINNLLVVIFTIFYLIDTFIWKPLSFIVIFADFCNFLDILLEINRIIILYSFYFVNYFSNHCTYRNNLIEQRFKCYIFYILIYQVSIRSYTKIKYNVFILVLIFRCHKICRTLLSENVLGTEFTTLKVLITMYAGLE